MAFRFEVSVMPEAFAFLQSEILSLSTHKKYSYCCSVVITLSNSENVS